MDATELIPLVRVWLKNADNPLTGPYDAERSKARRETLEKQRGSIRRWLAAWDQQEEVRGEPKRYPEPTALRRD